MVFTVGCKDPITEAQALFDKQGLVLLQPARDYIKPGGLVVLPPHGKPSYLDPYDKIDSQSGTLADFKAIVESQSSSNAVGFGAAVSGIGSIMPISFGFDKKRLVNLKQIDSGGSRMTSPMVSSLIKMDATKGVLTSQINQNANNRVFVVQEVYTAKSLTFTSQDQLDLQASYGAKNSPVKDCKLLSSGTGTGTEITKTGTGTETTKTGTGTGTGTGLGASLNVCRAATNSLALVSDAPIPFAVRLNEIVLTGSGLDIKYAGFKFPKSLGDSNDEKATIVVDPLKDLIHVKH